jgi:hypothetical protein
MSKLHVTQIQGYLSTTMTGHIDMSDYAHHSDATQIKRAFLTRGLAALATSHMTEMPIAELGSAITDGSKDGGIDLVYFNAAELTLYLVQTKWHEDGHGSMELGEVLKFIEGVKKVLDNNLGDLNERVQGKKADIERALFDANAKFMLVLAHTGQEDLGEEVEAALRSYVETQNDTSELMFLRVLKQSELHKAVAAGLAGAPVSAEVQLYGWGQVREPHFAVYGQVCAADVAEWMKANGPRLFEKNLRQFLGSSAVNQDIVDTLVRRPEDFWYFNNGITAVASDLAKKPIGGNSSESAIFECTGFCVVNGAQTVGSIFAAASQNAEAVAKAMVPVRIISSASSAAPFASEVTRFTNTQNAIEKRDFVALDPEQERIRQELHIEGVEYAYKSGASTGTAAKRFDLTEATVALACSNIDVALAVQAKREIGKLWEDLSKAPYKQLFNPSVTGPAVWQAVQAMRTVDQFLAAKTKTYTGRENLICVHGNRFIQWASLRRLGYAVGQPLTKNEIEVQAAVEAAVEEVVGLVKANYLDAYPASLFKNLAKCKVLASSI